MVSSFIQEVSQGKFYDFKFYVDEKTEGHKFDY